VTAQQALCHPTSQVIAAGFDFSSETNVVEYKRLFPTRQWPASARAMIAGTVLLIYP
jgi:hypothetical protein